MDNTSFPKMLDPRKKLLPDAQLLRWKDWFSRYKFSVKHLKGPQNILADFLSRPQKAPPPPQILSSKPLYILTLSDNHPPIMPYYRKATILPPNSDLHSFTDFKKYANEHLYSWLHLLFNKTNLIPKAQHFSTICPYTTIPFIQGPIPDELLWYVWSMTILHTSAIALAPLPIYHYICDSHNGETDLVKLLTLFSPLPFWRGSLYNVITKNNLWHVPKTKQKRFSCVFFLSRTYHAQKPDGVELETNALLWPESLDWVQPDPIQFKELGLILANFNKCVSKDCTILGPVPGEDKAYAYDELYQPPPHYVSSYYAAPSQEQELPLDSQGNILYDSQDPYEDDCGDHFTQLSLSLPGSSQYPIHCTQPQAQDPKPGDDPASPDPYLNIFDPLSYIQSNYDSDSDNNNLSPSHESICKG